jgi:copper chaperone CopZ
VEGAAGGKRNMQIAIKEETSMGITEKTIKVEGMHCRSCEMLLTDVLSEIKNVHKVSADYRKGTVTIAAEPGALEEAKKAIAKEGYKVVG